jgi:ABC-2 type transport system ATP-binding protein
VTEQHSAAGIQASGLTWTYRKNHPPVVNDLCLIADRGIVVAEGANGSGKSTLLRLLATVTPLQEGSLLVSGHDVRTAAGRRSARRHIGYLTQTTSPLSGVRVIDWVLYGAWLRDLPRRQRRESASQVIEACGLTELAKSPLTKLSVGQRRRADLARALVGWPSICILDEPTAGLDKAKTELVIELLAKHAESNVVVVADHGTVWDRVAAQTLDLVGEQ